MDQLVTETTPDQLADRLQQLLKGQAEGRFMLAHAASSVTTYRQTGNLWVN